MTQAKPGLEARAASFTAGKGKRGIALVFLRSFVQPA